VPLNVIGAGFAMPVTVMMIEAVLALIAAGANVTLNVQNAPGAT